MARKFHVVRKRWSSLEKNVVLAEEIIEAGNFYVTDGNLVLCDDRGQNIVATPAGTWLEIEQVDEIPAEEEPSTVIRQGVFSGGSR